MLGLSPVSLAQVFNSYGGKMKRKQENVFGKMDKARFIKFLKSGIGYGFHYVHAKKPNEIHHFEMTKSFMEKLAKPTSAVLYPNMSPAYPYWAKTYGLFNIFSYFALTLDVKKNIRIKINILQFILNIYFFFEDKYSKTKPTTVDNSDPLNTPILTPSIYSILLTNAKFPTNKLIVKPIPVKTPTA